MEQVGSDVVVTTTGTLVDPFTTAGGPHFPNQVVTTGTSLFPAGGLLAIGEDTGLSQLFGYNNAIVSGPFSFGPGLGGILPTSATGNTFGVGPGSDLNVVFIDAGLPNGSFTLPTATWAGQTIASLGVAPGTYTWTLDNRFNGDTITLQVNEPTDPPATTPEPATILGLVTVGALGAISRKRKA